jgi:hypothetical protein
MHAPLPGHSGIREIHESGPAPPALSLPKARKVPSEARRTDSSSSTADLVGWPRAGCGEGKEHTASVFERRHITMMPCDAWRVLRFCSL